MKTIGALIGSLFLVACAGATPSPQTPPAASTPAPKTESKPAPSAKNEKPPAPAKVPEPPAECRGYVEHAAAQCAAGDPRERLAAALEEKDGLRRDALLVCLESEKTFPAGLMRALRSDLGPEVCADALAEPALGTGQVLEVEYQNALLGLSLAAKLARLASAPPKLEGPFDKQRFTDFFETQLKPWLLSQSAAIGNLSAQGARLTGYGKAIAAVAAGAADLRFVDMLREIPLPEEMKKDADLRDTYYGALDEALEPRKQRGRDAALVGLGMLSRYGILRDARITRARALLSKVYSGSRVDSLDRLLLPEVTLGKASNLNERLAAALPSYYAGVLLEADPSDVSLLSALTAHGLPPNSRKKLEAQKLSPKVQKIYARALVELGKVYFQASEFRRAAELLGEKPADQESALISAVASALASGPADVSELMLKGPRLGGLGSSPALDALAKANGPLAGAAAFDSAYLLELVPRPDDAKFWEDVASRYHRATGLLKDPGQKGLASDYERAATATAKALQKGKAQ